MTEIIFDCEVQSVKINKKRVMSICGWYDSDRERFDVCEWDVIQEFIEIASDAPVLVCYNGLRFDFALFATLGYPPTTAKEKTFDLFFELTKIIYNGKLPPKSANVRSKRDPMFRERGTGGLDLDSLGKLNLGFGKVQLDATPAQLWEAGQYDLVEAYNKRDVVLTRGLLYEALNFDQLVYENKHQQIETIDCSSFNERINYLEKMDLWGW